MLDAAWQSVVDVDQFYGIELGEFPARIAETALWMMDHIMNNRLSLEFGRTFVRIPLEKSPHIVHGDALETDWSELLPPADCSFVFGNPPFAGDSKYADQDGADARQVHGIEGARRGRRHGWTTSPRGSSRPGAYVKGSRARIGVRRDQLDHPGRAGGAALAGHCSSRCGLESRRSRIRTFAWGSDARGKAHVHVVVRRHV